MKRSLAIVLLASLTLSSAALAAGPYRGASTRGVQSYDRTDRVYALSGEADNQPRRDTRVTPGHRSYIHHGRR